MWHRILVLDHGKVVEFGTPWDLIQKDGMFRELCRQSGEDAQLMEVSPFIYFELHVPAYLSGDWVCRDCG